MGEESNIGWTNHTSSPWYGCTQVDPCCVNCYAMDLTNNRFAHFMRAAYRKAGFPNWETMPVWGDKAVRVTARDFDKKMRKWNKEAEAKPYRPRTFTSLMDWLDDMPAGIISLDGDKESIISVVGFYLRAVYESQGLDHLLLTKRPENFLPRVKAVIEHFGKASCNDGLCSWLESWLAGSPPDNVWFGYTAGTKAQWKARHELCMDIPAKVTWCSCEPMLDELTFKDLDRGIVMDWLVVGLESGHRRRSREIEPMLNLVQEAQSLGVKVYVKQDEGLTPGQQGRIPDDVWALKQFPA